MYHRIVTGPADAQHASSQLSVLAFGADGRPIRKNSTIVRAAGGTPVGRVRVAAVSASWPQIRCNTLSTRDKGAGHQSPRGHGLRVFAHSTSSTKERESLHAPSPPPISCKKSVRQHSIGSRGPTRRQAANLHPAHQRLPWLDTVQVVHALLSRMDLMVPAIHMPRRHDFLRSPIFLDRVPCRHSA